MMNFTAGYCCGLAMGVILYEVARLVWGRRPVQQCMLEGPLKTKLLSDFLDDFGLKADLVYVERAFVAPDPDVAYGATLTIVISLPRYNVDEPHPNQRPKRQVAT